MRAHMPKYTLTHADRIIVERVARARSQANRAANVVDMRKSAKMSSLEIDMQGFAGELAFCRLFRLRPDESVQPRSRMRGEDRLGDAVLPDGRSVDVKSPSYNDHYTCLIASQNLTPDLTADLFALMLGSHVSGVFQFAGFMSAKELLRPERLRVLRPSLGERFVASQSELVIDPPPLNRDSVLDLPQ